MTNLSSDSGVWLVVPAAGVGSRMGAETPKQYLTVHSRTILEHTISRFMGLDSISGVLVVVGEGDPYWPRVHKQLITDFGDTPVRYTYGGKERSDTVANGLNYLAQELQLSKDQWVMVHDAARPCVRRSDLLALIALRASERCVGGILASPVKDTMKRAGANNEHISHTESRDKLWHALTPQLFRLGELSKALNAAALSGVTITDEASAMEHVGKSVTLVEAASDNIKLTTPSDLPLIEFLLTQRGIDSNA